MRATGLILAACDTLASKPKLLKDADKDQNDVIDFEEFVKATPKTLRVNLVKLAKKNGHDLGFLV